MDKPGRYIVTRTQPGADETAARLKSHGLIPIPSPLLSIEPLDNLDMSPAKDADALIFTSANGVRVFSQVAQAREQIAICVGPSTYEAAVQSGFASTLNADGNADDVFDLITRKWTPAETRFCHVANEDAAGELVARLRAVGYGAVFLAAYVTRHARKLSSPASDALRNPADGPIAVLLHSAKAGSVFSELIEQSGNTSLLQTVIAIAISERAADSVRHLPFKETLIASRPNEEALFDKIRSNL